MATEEFGQNIEAEVAPLAHRQDDLLHVHRIPQPLLLAGQAGTGFQFFPQARRQCRQIIDDGRIQVR